MSANKRKYYRVTTTQIVHANSKTEALNKARRKRSDAVVLNTDIIGEQILAAEAKNELTLNA